MLRQLRSAGYLSLSATLALAIGANHVNGQAIESESSNRVVTHVPEWTGGDGNALQEGKKSGVLAGFLSFLIPGVGSYYAENSGHGTRHLIIHGVALGITIWGAAETTEDIIDDTFLDEDDIHPALWVGATMMFINGIWAIATAVTDVSAYNRTLSLGPADLEPSIVVLSSPALLDAQRLYAPGIGVQLARIRF